MTASNHQVHGLAGDDMAPDWPPLQEAEVQSLLNAYAHARGPTAIVWHSPRPFSAAARVTTPAGEVFVKRHHAGVRSAAALTAEHALIAHLRGHGLPIPAVLTDDRGETALTRGPWTYEVHATAAGVDLFRDRISWEPLTDINQARTAGRMLARLHRAAADFHAPQRDTWILVARDDLLRAADLVGAVDAQQAQRPALADYLQRRDWRNELAPLVKRQRAVQPRLADLPRLWTHNDWHVSNLCWTSANSNANVSAVLDFGLASPTFALYDLATAIERNAIAWMHLERGKQAIFPRTARALIEGYETVLPLPDSERELLADLLPVVHIDFALSEVEYFHGITGSTKHADVAWDTFLLGHAAWFDTSPGQALLQAIRTRR